MRTIAKMSLKSQETFHHLKTEATLIEAGNPSSSGGEMIAGKTLSASSPSSIPRCQQTYKQRINRQGTHVSQTILWFGTLNPHFFTANIQAENKYIR